MLVAYLNNTSEETIFGSNRIENLHETLKLQNEEVMLRSFTGYKRCSERGTRNRHQRIFRKILPNYIHIENIDEKIKFYDSDETEIRLPF